MLIPLLKKMQLDFEMNSQVKSKEINYLLLGASIEKYGQKQIKSIVGIYRNLINYPSKISQTKPAQEYDSLKEMVLVYHQGVIYINFLKQIRGYFYFYLDSIMEQLEKKCEMKPRFRKSTNNRQRGELLSKRGQTGHWMEQYEHYAKEFRQLIFGKDKDGLKQGKWKAYYNNTILQQHTI
ncbi:unnamed protein product [Paramecium octaurelia]|uniref:Uncharacterized protein n=1 Tax=Paramecium octaurelia TaxID=43137 RepID=A0A8S1TR79_PAROT|nr:unnamed protein product [Paramecium octaurelia]